LADFPNDFEALRVMGYVHSSHGNLVEMFKCWRACSELRPDRADVYDQLGRYAMQTDNYEEAIKYWQQCLKIDPSLSGVHQNIAWALLNLGRTDEAIASLQREISMRPDSSQAYFLMAEAHFQRQEFAKAKEGYLAAARLEPRDARAYYGLVKTCSRLDQRDESARYAKEFQRLETAAASADLAYRRQYDDLQKMREQLAVTCVDAGRIYLSRGNQSQAARLWQRATSLDPQNVSSRSLLASLHLKKGKRAEALNLYLELVKIEPSNAVYYQQIGSLQARAGNLAAAEAAFRKRLELQPQAAAGHRSLAKFYLNTNQQLEHAEELALQAVKLEPVADSFFVLGWARAKNGNRMESLAALQEAIRRDPNNPTYRKLYERIKKEK
jgi:tetratricopeptide (TPR) repeat protein